MPAAWARACRPRTSPVPKVALAFTLMPARWMISNRLMDDYHPGVTRLAVECRSESCRSWMLEPAIRLRLPAFVGMGIWLDPMTGQNVVAGLHQWGSRACGVARLGCKVGRLHG